MNVSSTKLLMLAAIVGVASMAPKVIAGRTLQEPKEIQNLPRKMNTANRAAALKAEKLEAVCSRSRLKTREIGGLQCRLALFRHQVRTIVPDSEKKISNLVDAARLAQGTAKSIANYQPVTKKPGLTASRFKAHQMACNVVNDVVAQLQKLPASASGGMKTLAARAQSGAGDAYNVNEASCDCMKVSVGLAAESGASIETRGAIQGRLTSSGCLLDKTALDQKRGGPKGFSGNAAGVAAASSEVGQLLEYAKARDIGLNRCRSKYISASNKVSRPSKLKRCACDEVNRWRFPKKRGRKDVEITVPIQSDTVGIKIVVAAVGKVKTCGDLVGPGL